MNPIEKSLAGSPDATAVARLANQFGTDPAATRAVFATVIEALGQRMERNTLSRGGLADLIRAIGDPHHAGYIQHPELTGSEIMDADGKAILGHVLGSKEKSRAVAARAARASGIPAQTVENMLPQIAALTMGEISRVAQGPIDEILRRIPGLDDALREMGKRTGGGERRPGSVPDSGGDRGGFGHSGGFEPSGRSSREFPGQEFPGQEFPGKELPSQKFPDQSLPDQQPLPLPGEIAGRDYRAPSRYDDLSDILRRGGGGRVPKTELPLPDNIPGSGGGAAGGTLYNIVRALIGALLGFQSRGLVGWLIRLVVMRWGWGFIQRILGRLLGRLLTGR